MAQDRQTSERPESGGTRTNGGSPLSRFFSRLGDILGLNRTPGSMPSGTGGKPKTAPRSVERAAQKGGARGQKARSAVSKAKGSARKPPARKIAHRSGAKMADAAKADTRDAAKEASRARSASGKNKARSGSRAQKR